MLQLQEHFKHKNEKGLDTCNKGDIALVYEPNKKIADFKPGLIESFKPFQGGKKRIAVVKCMIKGRIATLMRPINMLYPIETSPNLMDEDVLPKLKFVNEKKIKLLKHNWYIDIIFLGKDVVVHINLILLRLFVQLPIYFALLFYYGLVGMLVNLGVSLVLILRYISDRRELLFSEPKLENLFFFTSRQLLKLLTWLRYLSWKGVLDKPR